MALLGAVAVALALAAGSDGKGFVDTVFSAADTYTRKESAAAQLSPLPPWSALRPLLVRTAGIMAGAAAALAVIAWRRAGRWTAAVVAIAMLAVTPVTTRATELVVSARAVAGLAAEARRLTAAGALLAHEGPLENSGALEFYSGRRPVLVDARRSVLAMGATFPDAAGSFWTAEELRAAWLSGRPIVLVTPREPERSVVSSLPGARVRLVRAENGRWLYASVPGGDPR
jgi:hypothetical protein